MITRESVKGLVGRRVAVNYPAREPVILQFRGITPLGDAVFLANDQGFEEKFPVRDMTITDAPLTCSNCNGEAQRLHGPDKNFCADCERDWAARHATKPDMPCEREGCENGSAFFSPAAGKFMCAGCHANAGTLSGNGVEARVLEDVANTRRKAASCRSADISDGAHDWAKVKSKRVCRNCGVNVFVGEFKKDPCLG